MTALASAATQFVQLNRSTNVRLVSLGPRERDEGDHHAAPEQPRDAPLPGHTRHERAERIAHSLHIAVASAQSDPCAAPKLFS